MTEFTKGGRGKAAPYDTTHHRIPEPCKNTVKTVCDTWKHLLSDDENGESKAQKLLTDIENVTTMHYIQEFEQPVNGYVYKLATATENTQDKLSNELLDLLNSAIAVDGRRGVGEVRKVIAQAIQLLEQNLQ